MPTHGRRRAGGSAGRVAVMGLLFALAMVLGFAESLLPVLPGLPPGVKLGLSNIVTMYTLFFLGAGPGFTMAALKALFALLTRGPVAGAMSLGGGLCSVLVMFGLRRLPRWQPSELLQSVCGAIFHNVGQLLVAGLVLKSAFVWYYLPVLTVSGVLMGCLTGLLLRVMTPYMNRLSRTME